jgi:hypothetical protein
MLTSPIRRAFVGAVTAGSFAAVAAAAGDAAENRDPSGIATFQPIEAVSYQIGSKRAVGYFEARGGKCQVTLMIAEAVDPDQAWRSSAARLSLAMAPGQSAALVSEEGASMELTCGGGAQTVTVARVTPAR